VTDKIKFRVEFEKDGPLKVVRPHRQFFGRQAVAEPLLVEAEWEEHENLWCSIVDESEGTLGRAARATGKMDGQDVSLVFTADPGLYGTDDERLAADKMPFVELKWGEWNVLNLHEL
jgi:hypothetical protein